MPLRVVYQRLANLALFSGNVKKLMNTGSPAFLSMGISKKFVIPGLTRNPDV